MSTPEKLAPDQPTTERRPRFAFFVYIIDLPEPAELYSEDTELREGPLLAKVVRLDGITAVVRCATTREMFERAIGDDLLNAMAANPGMAPIVHISGHGNEHGIGCGDGLILWSDLREMLIPINRALEGALLVCLSACDSYAGTRMAMTETEEEELPFFAIVGSCEKPIWSDTAVAFMTFYHLIARGAYVVNAVRVMNDAAGCTGFMSTTGTATRKSYIEYLRSLDTAKMQEVLRDVVVNPEPATATASAPPPTVTGSAAPEPEREQ